MMKAGIFAAFLSVWHAEAFVLGGSGLQHWQTRDVAVSSRRSKSSTTPSSSSHRRSRTSMSSTSAQEDRTADYALYGTQGSRSPLVNWYLYEHDVAFDFRDVAIPENRESNPHPFRQVPCLVHLDGLVEPIHESGAILIYLAQRFGELQECSDEDKIEVIKWVMWANSSLDPVLFKETPEGKVFDTGMRKDPKELWLLEALFDAKQDTDPGKEEWMAGPDFTCADVAVGAYLLYVPQFFPDVSARVKSKYPALAQYMVRCCSRPAYAKAYGQELVDRLKSLLT